ncbi:hypothetical protein D1007_52334 [Hordeum vulgare]|nr:hypothetical protein D1007_52334 [Hordeum vulgare]
MEIHEGIFQSLMQTSSFVEHYISELEQIATPVLSNRLWARQSTTQRWVASSEGFVKINVDGAVARNGHGGAVDVVCRDHMGMYVGACDVVYTGITDPVILETFACGEALALTDDLLLSNLKVASDCLGVVNDINNGT